jgi:polysaccharide deacetylase family protein (PEP-CTERM system associated)
MSGYAAFSADVEDYFQVEALRGLFPRERWEECEDRTEPSTNRLLDLLERTGTRGTFFVLGWTALRHPDLVRRIVAGGHEIASHGFDHELVYNQTPEAFRQDVRRAKALLEDLSGQEVVGYRAPSYTIVQRTLWALPILAEEGYLYDSSIFPIPRRRYGMPKAQRWPHRITLKGSQGLAEFPLPTVRFGPLNMPATGGAYLRLLPFHFQRWALRRILEQKRAFVLTIHPWELDPEQPRLSVGLRTRWTHYSNLHRTEERLEALLGITTYIPISIVLQRMRLLQESNLITS